jgi:hypothetical protein
MGLLAISLMATSLRATPLLANSPVEVLKSEITPIVDVDFEHDALAWETVGEAVIRECGPTQPIYQGMPATNRALQIHKAGTYLKLSDPGEESPLDFQQGDSITIEAWVKTDAIRSGANVYIVSKGRTYETAETESHNYALRLTCSAGMAKLSFLFSTRDEQGKLNYHRWTSTEGFVPDGLWHHCAVSYEFGNPTSVRGVLDGIISTGKWDMGGATERPPVTDNDSVWIGSSRGGAAANSFIGELDDVRIHRRLVETEDLITRRVILPMAPKWPATAQPHEVTITLHEAAGSYREFALVEPLEQLANESFRFTAPALAIHRLPLKVIEGGLRAEWKGPVLMRAFCQVELPAGEIEFCVRSPGRSRLWIDGKTIVNTPARKFNLDAHQPFRVYQPDMPWLRVPRIGDNEERVTFISSGGRHEIVLESLVGSESSRCETGETLVAMRQGEAMFTLLAPRPESQYSTDLTDNTPAHLVDEEFEAYRDLLEQRLSTVDYQQLADESVKEDHFWHERHRLARMALSRLPAIIIPPESAVWQQFNAIDRFINIAAAHAKDGTGEHAADQVQLDQLTSDLEFLRRLSLDTVGVPPSPREVSEYLDEPEEERRNSAIERLLADDRWADHWTSYWQDVLAENPNILKPSLNNTGPFRWWIHDSLRLNKPVDRFVTELIRMEGGQRAGGPAGFGLAAQNDVPMAEKAHVISSAFLAMDMKCARCHDAPYHPWTQEDLFRIGAMLEAKAITVPETSSVPKRFFELKGDDAPIAVTLQPGDVVPPSWPAEKLAESDFGPSELDSRLLGREESPREQLAALVTRAENRRFANVFVNRVWTRLMGWGLVSDPDDWYESETRHPDLLDYLSRELINSGYDMKHLTRLIVSSRAYQRRAINDASTDPRLVYSAPWHRRLSAEQVVDSLQHVTGSVMETEAITFDPEASQKSQNFLNLGTATKAWQLTSLSNERDRPSLALPRAAAVVECLEAFGWRASRQSPITHREYEANMVQPGVIANGHLTGWATRLTEDSHLTQWALDARSADDFIEQIFLAVLTRSPTEAERQAFRDQLEDGFDRRLVERPQRDQTAPVSRGFATWTNHFSIEANELMREIERETAAGPQATDRLTASWRERAEDAVWALLNSPEFQFIP